MIDRNVSVRVLGIAALVLGVFAAVAGSPSRGSSAHNVNHLAKIVENEEDHVTAVELAEWIRDRKANLRIVDIRDSADFDQYHIPSAERLELARLVAAKFSPGETIVLYSGGGAHAAQGWVFLRALGLTKVYFLRGGVDEWLDEVINPQFPRNPTAAEKADIDRISALSRYFGGSPRLVDSVTVQRNGLEEKGSWKATVAKIRGRGC